jgi:hypothetical protein
LAWRKIEPKILSVEKKGQISGMTGKPLDHIGPHQAIKLKLGRVDNFGWLDHISPSFTDE